MFEENFQECRKELIFNSYWDGTSSMVNISNHLTEKQKMDLSIACGGEIRTKVPLEEFQWTYLWFSQQYKNSSGSKKIYLGCEFLKHAIEKFQQMMSHSLSYTYISREIVIVVAKMMGFKLRKLSVGFYPLVRLVTKGEIR
jgi:hypothetical protein